MTLIDKLNQLQNEVIEVFNNNYQFAYARHKGVLRSVEEDFIVLDSNGKQIIIVISEISSIMVK